MIRGSPKGERKRVLETQPQLPAPIGSALGEEMWIARGTDSIRRRFRGDVQDGIEGEGGASTNPICDEQVGIDAAPGKDADGELDTREGKLRVSGLHDSQEAEHPAEPAAVLHAAVAVAQGHEEDPDTSA